jgi:hypothetical protein
MKRTSWHPSPPPPPSCSSSKSLHLSFYRFLPPKQRDLRYPWQVALRFARWPPALGVSLLPLLQPQLQLPLPLPRKRQPLLVLLHSLPLSPPLPMSNRNISSTTLSLLPTKLRLPTTRRSLTGKTNEMNGTPTFPHFPDLNTSFPNPVRANPLGRISLRSTTSSRVPGALQHHFLLHAFSK